MSTIPKLIFIIPYRDRESQKQHFSIYMKYIMEDYSKDDYEIYYSHQTDNRPFNRGATKNIGFLVMKNKYPNDYKNITFVFNDIDIVPAVKNTLNYITTSGIVKHFYGYTFALGGIFSIIGSDFEKCNGFPNNWGWGLEDNAINDRALQQSLIINRDQFFPINSTHIIHLYDHPYRMLTSREPTNYLSNNLTDNLNSISNINYTIYDNNSANEESNKITSIKQNEYTINIHQFQTLIPANSNNFFTQNMYTHPTIQSLAHNKRHVKSRWLLNNLIK